VVMVVVVSESFLLFDEGDFGAHGKDLEDE
jgi:hypothetical protein